MANTTKPLAGLKINRGHRLSQNLVGWWVFNDGAGAILTDYTVHRNGGTLINMNLATAWVGSPLGGAIDFDGVNDYITIANQDVLNFGAGVLFTVSLWLKVRDVSVDKTVITKQAADGYNFRFTTGGGWFARIDAPSLVDTPVNANLSDGRWHHVVFGRDAVRHFVYVDGLFDNAVADTSLGATTNTASLFFGSAAGVANFFDGVLDDIRMWNSALNSDEIQQLFTDPYANVLRPSISRTFTFAAISNVPRAMQNYRRTRVI